MNKMALLEEINNFRNRIISKRDSEIQHFCKQSDNFINQIAEWGIVDVSELKKRQEEVIKLYIQLYKPYLDALAEKEKEIKDGKLDMFLQ